MDQVPGLRGGEPHIAFSGFPSLGPGGNEETLVVTAGALDDVEDLKAISFATQGKHQQPPDGGISGPPLDLERPHATGDGSGRFLEKQGLMPQRSEGGRLAMKPTGWNRRWVRILSGIKGKGF